MIAEEKPDGLILDMDGTLWDNVDTYAKAWTEGFKKCGENNTISREDIIGLMGKEARVMLNTLIPEWTDEMHDTLFEAVIDSYQELVPTMKPVIYEGVIEGMERLAKDYKLFLLSNCEKDGLVNFMNHTKTNHLIIDYMEHGMNLKPKHHNMQLLIDKHDLKSPVYVGDTDSDSVESAKAGVPFVFMTYGFGNTENYSLKFDTFNDLTEYYVNLANKN
ncbi:MAG: HAD hydrolase-like protein [Fermentimonas sp.]|nr:HAD hydrolase-like protein [Fermentimonas sp.]